MPSVAHTLLPGTRMSNIKSLRGMGCLVRIGVPVHMAAHINNNTQWKKEQEYMTPSTPQREWSWRMEAVTSMQTQQACQVDGVKYCLDMGYHTFMSYINQDIVGAEAKLNKYK